MGGACTIATIIRMTNWHPTVPVGQWYDSTNPAMWEEISRNLDLVHQYNALLPSATKKRALLLKQILHPDSGDCVVQSPMMIEWGRNTRIGTGSFINFGVTILDGGPVTIGERVLIGPNCQIITVTHPVDDIAARAAAQEIAQPVTIGDDAWLGAGVIVLPGVSIGAGAVIGAGSIVTRDIPPRTVAMGQPACVHREIS